MPSRNRPSGRNSGPRPRVEFDARTEAPSVASGRLSAEQFRGALDGLLEGVQLFDRDLRYVYVNPAAAAQGRHDVSKVVGRLITEVFPGSEESEYYRVLREVLRDGKPRRLQTEFRFGDGSAGHFDLSIESVDGGIFVLSIENTNQRLAEKALDDALGRYRALVEELPDWVFLIDRRGTVLDVHVPKQSPMPVDTTRVVGRPWLTGMPPSVALRASEALQRAIQTGKPQSLQFEYPMPDGSHHFEATIVGGANERLTVVARDVSARVDLEQQLRQAQKMEAIGQLTGGIAHDFNNVLQIITANADLLADQFAARGEAPSPELSDILSASHRGAQMIAQLMQFGRRSAGERQFVDPNSVLTRITMMLRRILPASVSIELDAVPSGITLSLDAGALEQIVTNLCTNARDAMPSGGTIRIRSERRTLEPPDLSFNPALAPGDYLCISVIDSGVGMSEETLRRVFEPFYTTKEAGVGTGLGMAMVYGLMKSQSGAVEVRSTLGAGTEVRLYFPVVAAPLSSDPQSLSTGSRRVAGGGETLLLVEDDAAIRTVMRRVLELKGYHVLEAPDGASGLALFRQQRERIGLVISDVMMPNLGGRQMADAIRAAAPEMPLLFTSGYSSTLAEDQGALQRRTHFLPKPWALSDLLTQVRRALDG